MQWRTLRGPRWRIERQTCMGRVMFLSVCRPPSSKTASSRLRTSSCTRADRQIPPGVATSCKRAATFTPSPKMSSPSTMMSPMIDADAEGNAPVLRLSPAVRSAIAVCTSTTQRTASTTLANSSSSPSPVVLTMRPPWLAICGIDDFPAQGLQRRQRAALIATHQPRVAGDVGRDDGGKAALLGHSGSPASRKPCLNFAMSLSRRRANRSLTLEIRAAGSNC